MGNGGGVIYHTLFADLFIFAVFCLETEPKKATNQNLETKKEKTNQTTNSLEKLLKFDGNQDYLGAIDLFERQFLKECDNDSNANQITEQYLDVYAKSLLNLVTKFDAW